MDFKLGKDGDDISNSIVPSVSPIALAEGDFDYHVELSGDLSVHILPQLELGISVLGGAVLDAQVRHLDLV